MGLMLDVAAGILIAAAIIGVVRFGFIDPDKIVNGHEWPMVGFSLAAIAVGTVLVIARFLRWP